MSVGAVTGPIGTLGIPRSGAPIDVRGAPMLPGFDMQAAMFQAQNLLRTARSKTALSNAESAQANRDKAIGDARSALQQAEEKQHAAETKGKWLSALRTIGTIAAVAVAACSMAFTGGASTPAVIALVGVLISASSPYVADATHSEKLGLALALAGATMSLGAGAYSLLSAGAQAASTMTTAQKGVLMAGRLTSATAEAGQGAGTIARGQDEAAAMEDRADAQSRRADAAREQIIIDESIAVLEQVERSNRRAVNNILAVGDTLERARATAITNIRRA